MWGITYITYVQGDTEVTQLRKKNLLGQKSRDLGGGKSQSAICDVIVTTGKCRQK